MNYLKWSPKVEILCMQKGIRAYCAPGSYEGMPNALFRNNGDGTFTDVSEESGIARLTGKGMGIAFADYDGDGFVDVFVSNDSYRNFLLHNNGNGTFSEVALFSGVAYNEEGRSMAGMGVDFRDLDNDGLPDIFETAMYGDTFPLYHNLGKGVFEDVSSQSRLESASLRLTGWGAGFSTLTTTDGRTSSSVARRFWTTKKMWTICPTGCLIACSRTSATARLSKWDGRRARLST